MTRISTRIEQGLSTIVELLTADRDLANARYTIVQSRADLLTSSAAVAYAVGRSRGLRRRGEST